MLKRTPALLLATVFLTPLLAAQEAAPQAPGTSAFDLMPALPPEQPSSVPEQPLIPETPPATTKPAGRAIADANADRKAPKKSSTQAAEDAIQQRVKLRNVKTKALSDPAVLAEWDRAEAARTDEEKRAALKAYYKKLYGRMLKIDGSLKAPINTALTTALGGLEQTRVSPTVPR